MSSVTSTFLGPVTATYYVDEVEPPRARQLAAVVVWRGVPRAPSRTAVAKALRRVWERMGSPTLQAPWKPPPEPWSGAAGQNGARESRYNRQRRTLRVLGRDYPLPPDGQALVLLIDEGNDDAEPPRVSVHRIASPPMPLGPIDPTLDEPARTARRQTESKAEWNTWQRLLDADPAIREFMSDR